MTIDWAKYYAKNASELKCRGCKKNIGYFELDDPYIGFEYIYCPECHDKNIEKAATA